MTNADRICPKCNLPGGVLLLNLVAPCDQCVAGKSRMYDVVLKEVDEGDGPPEGIVGFLGWSERDDAEGWIARRRKTICDTTERHTDEENVTWIGGSSVWRPHYWDEYREDNKRHRFFAFVLKGSSVRRRAPVSIGKIPDSWHGAPGSMRWAEGRGVTMVFDADDVPMSSVLHSWMYHPYCSAHDCDMEKVRQKAEDFLRNPRRWQQAPPADSRDEAVASFKNDHVLLFITR